jgi:hypothetical protein
MFGDYLNIVLLNYFIFILHMCVCVAFLELLIIIKYENILSLVIIC